MGRRLFVGNLSFDTTDQELKDLFSTVGTCVSASVMRDRSTARARGFAFVEMSTEDEAQQAIARLNNAELGGRNLNVSEARERSAGPRPFSGPPPGFGGPPRGYDGDGPPRFRKDGGSRRGLRARKRSL
jgi:cold-inducible RNA-binding protein